jgi:Tol biopolymer transport system component
LRNGTLIDAGEVLRAADPAPSLPEAMDGPYRAFSTDGRLLAYQHDRQVRVRDVTTGDDREIARCRANLCSVTWSPDGSTLAVADQNRLTAHDVRSGDERLLLRDFRFIADLAWSPDGRTIAFRGIGVEGDALRLFDVASGWYTWLYDAGPGRVAAGPSWAPDGRTLAFVEFDWSDDRPVDATAMTVEPEEHADPVPLAPSLCPCVNDWPSLAWSPDGRSVAVSSAFGSAEPVDSLDVLGRRVTVEYVGGAGTLAWQPLPPR